MLRLLDDQIGRSDGRQLLDINPNNNAVRIVAGAAQVQVPTVSWLGLVALIFGVVLVAQNRDFVSKS